MKPIGPTHRPHPEEVTRSLLRVTVSKDGSGRDLACGRPSRRRALRKRAPPQDEDYGCADMIPTSETLHYISADHRTHCASTEKGRAGRRAPQRLQFRYCGSLRRVVHLEFHRMRRLLEA